MQFSTEYIHDTSNRLRKSGFHYIYGACSPRFKKLLYKNLERSKKFDFFRFSHTQLPDEKTPSKIPKYSKFFPKFEYTT